MTNLDCFDRKLLRAVSILLPLLLIAFARSSGFAGSATWKTSPSNGIWNRAANWDPATVPSHPRDTATFATSTQSAISLRAPTRLGASVFNSGASAYSFTIGPGLSLEFVRDGVTNNSGVTQSFTAITDAAGNFGLISFSYHSSAGNLSTYGASPGLFAGAAGGFIQLHNFADAGSSIFVNSGASISGASGGETDFFDSTSAGSATITAKAGSASGAGGGTIAFSGSSTAASSALAARSGEVTGAHGGLIYFRDSSSAKESSITIEGGLADGATGANMYFEDTASAGNAFIYVEGGGVAGTSNGGTLSFLDSSTSLGAQIFVSEGPVEGAQPGRLFFYDDSDARLGIIRLFDGVMDICPHNPGTVTVGTILGYYGTVFLGSNNLEIGGNGILGILDVVFQDGGIAGGSGGSITKAGTNTLELDAASTFTGGITVNNGTLTLNSSAGSASGPGPVVINKGNLYGFYTIDGPISVNNGGKLLPWGNAFVSYYGSFETKSTVTFGAGSSYVWDLKTGTTETDMLIADGVTIGSGAIFTPVVSGSTKIEAGTELIAISNTSANPISGSFAGYPEGAAVPLGPGNTALVSYTGGDGNDFTFTVLP
jgi:autotransporter-associated beta strand protein